MKKWLLILVAIILAILQLTWPVFLIFFNCKPDLLLALSIILVFALDFKTALVFVIFCGLLKDIFLISPVALNAILFAIWGYLIHKLSTQISTENDYVRLGIVLIAVLLNNITIGALSINSGNAIPFFIFLRNLVISTFYTVALFPLVSKLIRKITR